MGNSLPVLTLQSLVPRRKCRSKLQSTEIHILLKGKMGDKIAKLWEIIGFKYKEESWVV